MNIKLVLKNFLSRSYICLYGILHPIENKCLFVTFGGKQYGDNPRAISEKLHDMYPNIEIVWRINDLSRQFDIVPDYVRVVGGGRAYLKELSTCACFVTNCDINNNVYKRKHQIFVQTWHGDPGPKKVLYLAAGDNRPENPPIDNKVTDLCIAASDLGIRVYRESFRYSGEILKVGTPRNDKLIKNMYDEKKAVLDRLNIDESKKILLFAPTYRDNDGGMQKAELNIASTLACLKMKTGDEWICLVRAHSASKGLLIDDNPDIIDVSMYPDMADILLISDFLITDYSSSPGDFVLTKKPNVLFMPDKDEYEAKCRTFMYSYDEAGFIVTYSQQELEDVITNMSSDDFSDNCDEIIKYFNIVAKGNASEQIVQWIRERSKLK